MHKNSAHERVCGIFKCTNVKINAAGHFCAAHQQEMDQAPEPVEKWVAAIKLGAKNEASLRDQLDDQGVTEIDDLVEMDQDMVASLDLPTMPTKKFHAALYKLGNGSVQKPVQRRASATTEPAAMPFTEKWRQQAKLFEVPASAIVTQKMIGTGGFSQVYEGTIYGVRCAIKMFAAPTNHMQDEIMGMIKRESRPLSRVRHPNIIRLQHICLERNSLCIATELAPNGSLDEYLRKNPGTSVGQRFSFGHGMVAGMARLHSNVFGGKPKPILHNDLKPPNLLLGAMLEVKIADFGSSTGGHTTTTKGEGATGSTLTYEAPELLDGKDKSKQSDVYAFGVTLFEVMTGKAAWEGMSATAIMAAVLKGERPKLPARCHPFVAETIQMCWAQEPGDRPSFDELNRRFNEARMAHAVFREGNAKAEVVVVASSPGKTLEQEEVMGMVEATAEMRTDLFFGYDWAGSSTAEERDANVNWSDGESVAGSFWFKGFRERVKGQVLMLAQQWSAIRLLCIEGGPISQLEARTMATMRAEIIADLRPKGYTPAVSTQLVSFERFKQAFGGDGTVSGSGPPSAAERLGQPSAEDRKKEAVAEEEVRIVHEGGGATMKAAKKAGWRLQALAPGTKGSGSGSGNGSGTETGSGSGAGDGDGSGGSGSGSGDGKSSSEVVTWVHALTGKAQAYMPSLAQLKAEAEAAAAAAAAAAVAVSAAAAAFTSGAAAAAAAAAVAAAAAAGRGLEGAAAAVSASSEAGAVVKKMLAERAGAEAEAAAVAMVAAAVVAQASAAAGVAVAEAEAKAAAEARARAEAEAKRQQQLREAEAKRQQQLREAEAKRQQQLREAEQQRLEHALAAAQAQLRIASVSGVLKMKVKGTFGDSWPDAKCSFNGGADGGTLTYRTTDGSKNGTRTNCVLVDVANREGKRQHRFDVTGGGGLEAVELAAASDVEKREWVGAVDAGGIARGAVAKAEEDLGEAKGRWEREDRETEARERARKEAEEKARQEDALMAKYGVSTMKEALVASLKEGKGEGEGKSEAY